MSRVKVFTSAVVGSTSQLPQPTCIQIHVSWGTRLGSTCLMMMCTMLMLSTLESSKTSKPSMSPHLQFWSTSRKSDLRHFDLALVVLKQSSWVYISIWINDNLEQIYRKFVMINPRPRLPSLSLVDRPTQLLYIWIFIC